MGHFIPIFKKVSWHSVITGLVLVALISHGAAGCAVAKSRSPQEHRHLTSASTVTMLEQLSLDSQSGEIRAHASGEVSPHIIRYPKGNVIRTIWEFRQTRLSPELANQKLLPQWQHQGVGYVRLNQCPGPTVRLVVDVPKQLAILGSSDQPSQRATNTAHLALIQPRTHSAYSPLVRSPKARTFTPNRSTSPNGNTIVSHSVSPIRVHSYVATSSHPEGDTLAKPPQKKPPQLKTLPPEKPATIASISPIRQPEAPPEPDENHSVLPPRHHASTAHSKATPNHNHLTAMRQALAKSKVALGKAIDTINRQNAAIQALRNEMTELRQGVAVASLDQQTWLDDQLTKAQLTNKKLHTKLADLQRENQSLKLVVKRLEMDTPITALATEAKKTP